MGDGNVCSRDGEERSGPGRESDFERGIRCIARQKFVNVRFDLPFLISEGRFALEDDLSMSAVVQARREILTLVPLVKPVRSRVTPDGTASAERIIVEHEVFDLLAEE